MQLALDKLIEKKVKDPEVVALLVEGKLVSVISFKILYSFCQNDVALKKFKLSHNLK